MIAPLRLLTALLGALLLGQAAVAQPAAGAPDAGARSAVERFLALNREGALASAEGHRLLTGEMAGSTLASWGTLPAFDALVMTGGSGAVARLPAAGDKPDIYLFLHRQANGRWSIIAARAMALTGIPAEISRQLRAKAVLTPQERDSLAEIELTLSTDRQLAAWFHANRESLDQLRAMAGSSQRSGSGRIDSPEVRASLHRLHAAALEIDTSGAVVLTLGGMLDNAVGFLFARDRGQVPAIDSSDHIWIEAMGGGWYLFRTT